MSSEEMKQYSESVAQAADVVDTENSAAAQVPAKKSLDLNEKEAAVEQAEAANSVAFEPSKDKAATKKKSAKDAVQSKAAAPE